MILKNLGAGKMGYGTKEVGDLISKLPIRTRCYNEGCT